MKKLSILLSLLLASAMVLAACSQSKESTEEPSSTELGGMPAATEPVGTSAMTETVGTPEVTTAPVITPSLETTQPVISTQPMTGTEVIPATGFVDPGRVSNLLDFGVWDQNDQQIGEVEDMVLNLGTSQVDYVIVNTAGYPDTPGKLIPVPWVALKEVSAKAQTAGTSGPQNGFVLSVDKSTLAGAPEIDTSKIPELGEQADGWDADIHSYWQDLVSTSGSETPAPTTSVTPGPSTAEHAGLAGVALATKLLGINSQVAGGAASMAVKDVLLDSQSGALKYVVLSANTAATGERLIPIPLNILSWDAANKVFIPNVDPQAFLQAPSFEGGKFPPTITPDWDANLRSYWEKYITPGS